MRFILSRIFKNNSWLNKYWLSYLEKSDFKYYDKHCLNYIIIPFGDYCLPRVVSVINRLKPTKKYGEKTFPFDLCFSKFSINVNLLSENFSCFFDDVVYDENRKYYINSKTNMIFNHDGLLSINEFRQRYQKRIDNLYEVLNNSLIHIYFIVATFEDISNMEIEEFVKVINKFRGKNTYTLIIINQNNVIKKSNLSNVHYVNLIKDKCFKHLNRKGDWCTELKEMKSIDARVFNYKIYSQLSKIIIHHK